MTESEGDQPNPSIRQENEADRDIYAAGHDINIVNFCYQDSNSDEQLSIMISVCNEGPARAERQFQYNMRRDSRGLRIEPRDPYLDTLRSGGQLTPQSFTYSPWESGFAWPTLDIKTVNNTNQTVFFTAAELQVARSRIDRRPVPVIKRVVYLTDGIRSPLGNSGWGPMKDCLFRFHLEIPGDSTPLTKEYSWPLGEYGSSIDERPMAAALSEAGVGVRRRKGQYYWSGRSRGPFARERGPFDTKVVASGVLEYGQIDLDGSHTRIQNLATMTFVLGAEGVGAPAPPSWTYDVQLHAEGKDYAVTVPISQAIAPGEVDRFLFRVAADKSSEHDFNLALFYNGTERRDCGSVVLGIFVPAEYKWIKQLRCLPDRN